MEVKTAIESRRSIRKYLDKSISEELIKELFEAARLAPSAKNTQLWKFYILRSEAIKRLKDTGVFLQDFVYTAPLIIFCTADPLLYSQFKFTFEEKPEARALVDISLAAENLVLRATELNLGTCYIASFYKNKARQVLGISDKIVLPFAITVGYPAENPAPTSRKDIKEIFEEVK